MYAPGSRGRVSWYGNGCKYFVARKAVSRVREISSRVVPYIFGPRDEKWWGAVESNSIGV